MELQDFMYYPRAHEQEIRNTYQEMSLDVTFLEALFTKSLTPSIRLALQAPYCCVLAYYLILNTILIRQFDHDNAALLRDRDELLGKVIALAIDARKYRPLGASSVHTMLIVAWPADRRRRKELEELFAEYDIKQGVPVSNALSYGSD